MAKSDDEKKPEVRETETEHKDGVHTVKESTLVELSERVKDPTVNVTTKTYPPKPTDGKS